MTHAELQSPQHLPSATGSALWPPAQPQTFSISQLQMTQVMVGLLGA
jgi:hypothetical protein